jgi:DNA-binding NarL/FixJ family response regulator
MPIRVVIGEDEALLRAGLSHVLAEAGFQIVGSAGSGPDLVRLAGQHRPDLVVTDIRMPPGHTDEGLLAALRIRREQPGTAIVVLSQHLQRRYALELLTDRPAGIGYLLKQRIADVPTFCADLRRVCEGGTALDPEVVALMMTRAGTRDGALTRLTARQLEVLALIAEGLSNAAIARALTISEKAVVQHASRIYDQLGLPADEDGHRRVLAVVRYLSDPAR